MDLGKCVRSQFSSFSGKTAYGIPRSVSAIQRDIMKNGPVVAAFIVYADFMQYSGGIYKVYLIPLKTREIIGKKKQKFSTPLVVKKEDMR